MYIYIFLLIYIKEKKKKIKDHENYKLHNNLNIFSFFLAKDFAAAEQLDFIETSALTGGNVEIAFRRLILKVASCLPDVKVHLDISGLPEVKIY